MDTNDSSLPVNLPEHFYKYQPFCRVEDVVRRGQLYFSAPASFNDPFDCAIHPHFNYPRKVINRHYALILKGQGKRRAERKHEARTVNLSNTDLDEAFEKTISDFRNEYGVLCLSAIENDILMWSHYAENHTGLCFKFNTGNDFFQPAQPIEYRTQYPEIDFISLAENMERPGAEGDEAKKELASKLFLTKAEHWAYEREWRILRFDLDRERSGPDAVYFPRNALVGIILGCRAGAQRRDYIDRLLREIGSALNFTRQGRAGQNLVLKSDKPIHNSSSLSNAAAGALQSGKLQGGVLVLGRDTRA